MFWIARDLKNSKMGLIIKFFISVKKLTVFRNDQVVKFGNTDLVRDTRCADDFLSRSALGTLFYCALPDLNLSF